MNMPKRAACHHANRCARVASPGSGLGCGVLPEAAFSASCAITPEAPVAAIASMAAPVPFNTLRRVNEFRSMAITLLLDIIFDKQFLVCGLPPLRQQTAGPAYCSKQPPRITYFITEE
jgi:hypothetical protein